MSNTATSSRYITTTCLKLVASSGITQISLMEYDTAFLFACCFHKGRFDPETARQILFDPSVHAGREAVVNNMRNDLFFTKVATLDRAILELASYRDYPRSGKVRAEGINLTNGTMHFPHKKCEELAAEVNRVAPFDIGLHYFTLLRRNGVPVSTQEQAEWNLSIIRNVLRNLRLSSEWKVTLRWYGQTFEEKQGWEKVAGEYLSGILNVADCMSQYKGAKMAHYLFENGYSIVK